MGSFDDERPPRPLAERSWTSRLASRTAGHESTSAKEDTPIAAARFAVTFAMTNGLASLTTPSGPSARSEGLQRRPSKQGRWRPPATARGRAGWAGWLVCADESERARARVRQAGLHAHLGELGRHAVLSGAKWTLSYLEWAPARSFQNGPHKTYQICNFWHGPGQQTAIPKRAYIGARRL
eukprot:5701052-Prymnesium_polylepis.1